MEGAGRSAHDLDPADRLDIAGFGNRPVAWAQRAVEGFGFLLLGAEPGRASGVTRIDTADLIKGVAAYLGPSGPRWDPHFIGIERATVLLIGVAPPRDGDPRGLIADGLAGFAWWSWPILAAEVALLVLAWNEPRVVSGHGRGAPTPA